MSREMRLMIGGRSWAYVPCPLRLFARRRGGSAGSRWGVLLFPRVWVACIRLTGRPHDHADWRGGVQVGVETLPQGMQLLA